MCIPMLNVTCCTKNWGVCVWGGGVGVMIVSQLRLVLLTWSRMVRVPPVSGHFSLSLCLTSVPWSSEIVLICAPEKM